MTADRQAIRPMSRGGLMLATAGALVAGAVIVLGIVLPAEFNRDPLGLGQRTGLTRLWAPEEVEAAGDASLRRAMEYPAAPRHDVIEIPLGMVGGGGGPYSLEYKVAMKKDAVLIYEWEATGLSDASQLAYDFHGHTVPRSGDEKMVVATHRQAKGGAQRGSLVAPFDGIQGWYFDNGSSAPVVIRLKLWGFYDLVPAGQPGNEYGITANVPAERVRAAMAPPQG